LIIIKFTWFTRNLPHHTSARRI